VVADFPAIGYGDQVVEEVHPELPRMPQRPVSIRLPTCRRRGESARFVRCRRGSRGRRGSRRVGRRRGASRRSGLSPSQRPALRTGFGAEVARRESETHQSKRRGQFGGARGGWIGGRGAKLRGEQRRTKVGATRQFERSGWLGAGGGAQSAACRPPLPARGCLSQRVDGLALDLRGAEGGAQGPAVCMARRSLASSSRSPA